MSTILKALRRLEEEKTAVSEGRPLREEVASQAPPPQSAGRSSKPAAVALVLGLLVGGAVFGLLRSAFAPQEPVTVASAEKPPPPAGVTQTATPESPRPETSKASATDAPGPPEEAFASNVEVVPRQKLAPRIADSEPIETRRPERPGSRRPVESSSAAARAREAALEARRAAIAQRMPPTREAETTRPAVAAPPQAMPPPEMPTRAAPRAPAEASRAAVARTPEPQPSPTTSKAATQPPGHSPVVAASPSEPAPEPAPRIEPAAPSAEEAPRSRTEEPIGEGQAAPEVTLAPAAVDPAPPPALQVQRTEWHPLSDRRRAWVVIDDEPESRQVVEGDVVGDLLVSRIEPSGIVFERDGETLRRTVGER